MSVGDGIFGGLVFIGLVGLYVVTRDRWKWRRILAWGAAVLAVPILGVAGWAAYEKHKDSRPVVQQELWGLRIGMDEAAVLFAKGQPTQKEDMMWVFKDGAVYYLATFGEGRISHVRAITADEEVYALPSLQQLSNWSTLEDIEAKFGVPDAVSTSADKTEKTVTFRKYGVFFGLRKNQVVTLGVIGHTAKPLQYSDSASGRKD